MIYVVCFLVEKFHTAPVKSLVNLLELNQILGFKIFLHKDGQLRVVHVILAFKPISKCFQSLKQVIKAKDSRLALIDVVVLDFLTTPPLSKTQDT